MGEVHTEEGPKADILVLIEGRARYLAHLGHVKTPEILRGCAAEITRLRAALADAQAVGFAAGVEAAAKVAVAQAVYTRETIERATGSELVSNLVTVTKSKTAHDIETAIRALTPPDATAAAARVLLGDENALRKLTFAYDREDAAQRGEPNPHTFIDLDAPDMGASWVNERIGCAVSALRALTEKTS